MIVDHQSHWYPPAAFALFAAREEGSYPRASEGEDGWVLEPGPGVRAPIRPAITDLDEQLRLAREHGVDVLVSSASLLGEVLDAPADEAAELLRGVNALMAAAQREHPDRFVGLAMLPMQDADAALAVLDDAAQLGLGGVCLLPTIDGAPVAGEATLPVYARIAELGLPLFLHPESRTRARRTGAPMRGDIAISWMGNTAIAALDLIDGGTLDACPELVVLHPHLGGVLPWLQRRVDLSFAPKGRAPVAEYLRTRFWTDSVNGTPGALRFALDVYGADRVVFATDYPQFWSIADARAYVEAEGATAIYANRLPGLALPR